MKQPFAKAAAWLRQAWGGACRWVTTLPPIRRWLNAAAQKRVAAQDIAWRPNAQPEDRIYSRRVFAFTKGAIGYFALLIGSLIFTQVLRSRASNLFFWFVLLLLPAMLVYTLTARASLKVYMVSNSKETEKMSPCDYHFRVLNESILAYPFVDAIIRIPRTDAVRTEERIARLSMAPLSVYSVENSVTFRFRGTYEVGVSCFYVYDFFRIFRIRVDADCFESIYVMPRKRAGEEGSAEAVSDVANRSTKSPYSYDRLEISDIREYRLGDSLKSVHWNLSSKSEELIVRDYSSGVSNRAIVFCDMAAHYPTQPPRAHTVPTEAPATEVSDADRRRQRKAARSAVKTAPAAIDADMKTQATDDPTVRAIVDSEIMEKSRRRIRSAERRSRRKKADAAELTEPSVSVQQRQEPAVDVQRLAENRYYEDMNEYCADGVIELAVSAVLRELRQGNNCLLVWFDSRAEGDVLAYEMTDERDFDNIFRLFATAPLCRPEQKVTRLRTMLADTQSIKQIFVMPAPDEQTIAEFSSLPGLSDGANFGAVELLCYDAEQRFAHIAERCAYLENCRVLLSGNGLSLDVVRAQPDDAEQGKEVQG